MASQAQILANKENAQHSTGPKTQEGKSRSSLNSLRHGLNAATIVLPSEDMAAYQEFTLGMLADIEPVGALEQQLAQTVIDSQWRLNRVAVLETNLLALARLEPAPEHIASVEDPQIRAALLEANALIVHERQLRNLHLQEQRLRRVVNQAMDELISHQAAREAAQNSQPVTTLPDIGFDFPRPKSNRTEPSFALRTVSNDPAKPPVSVHAEPSL